MITKPQTQKTTKAFSVPSKIFYRACRLNEAYAKRQGGIAMSPSRNDSDLIHWKGFDFVVLQNVNGILAVYRMTSDGGLIRQGWVDSSTVENLTIQKRIKK